MRNIRFFLLAAWFCISLDAYAQTTYYVAPPPTGSNEEGIPDDPDNPFATIAYAINQSTGNSDTIKVLSGVYPQASAITVNKSITITGLGEDVTVLANIGVSPLFRITANTVTIEGIKLSKAELPLGGMGVLIAPPLGEDVNIAIRQNEISGFASGIELSQGARFDGLEISNNFINNNTNGILINQTVQFTENSVVLSNDLSGNNKAIINNSTVNNGIINAQANWWGSTVASGVTLEITNVNRVTYSPWLNTETDNNSDDEGFQGSFTSLGVQRITSNSNALTDAYDLVTAEGNITIYPSQVNNNFTYEAITINKNISFITASTTLIPIDRLITNGGNLILNGAFKVNELELIEGDIRTTGGNALIVSFGGVITENGTGQFLGEVKSDAFTLPANTPLNFLGVSISGGAGPLNNITISRTTGANAVATVGDSRSIEVLWDINVPDQNNISPRTLTFTWESIYDGEMNFNNLEAVIWKRPAPSSAWEFVDQTAINTDQNPRIVTVNNVTSFSQWIISDANNPLPVELTSFSASLLEPHVELNWETASEINSDFFSVERSENGKDFQEIGQLKAAGDSDTPLQYRYIDEQAARRFSGSLFYRLRTVDFDGSFEYSDITAVSISEDDIPMITAFAREGEASMKLFTRAIEPGDYHIWITDLSGRKIFEQDIELSPKEAYELGTGNLPQSVYLIRCVGNQLALSSKFRVEGIE
ncbi:hypothetical protein [Catalinimonas niigatensis]|uniref:hypothetical protein n=1 Tax=Catalinimonas niigatensis TaxID=1397264 RepID=UPI002666820B|nr:hypothetical protein [Catalinimonas niigatensis]WPP48418.1 hypothetical protein PZB72_17235 [Catalinimonas niigatensis]